MTKLTRLARLLAHHTPPALQTALPSLAALLALVRMQVGQAILCRAVLLAPWIP